MGVFRVFLNCTYCTESRKSAHIYSSEIKGSIGTKWVETTTQKMKFAVKELFSTFEKICGKLRICSHYERYP